MGLKDFDKISNGTVEKDNDLIDNVIFDMENIEYYLTHMDELVNLVQVSHVDYINSKVKYDLKLNTLQSTINWNEENALRESNGLSKCTNQTQKDAVIKLKVKHLKFDLKKNELLYKNYLRLYDFISKNFNDLIRIYNI